MTIIGVDDTDSRTHGMCTTYLATRLAERLDAAGATVQRRLLIRLNPAVEHKTRGNAALALHADVPPSDAFELARFELESLAIDADPNTSPGIVVADIDADAAAPGDATVGDAGVPESVAAFAAGALRRRYDLETALSIADDAGFVHAGYAAEGCDVEGRGRIGALAAIGAPAAFDDWTYEHIAYREFDRCGTPREVDVDSVFAAADRGYPAVWDTVDRVENAPVCVPNAPGPILYGIRGDDPDACRAVATRIDSEPVERAETFLTNQGTDAHVAPGEIGALRDGAGYRVDCVVAGEPRTRRGGHVFVPLAHPDDFPDGAHPDRVADAGDADRNRVITGAAFEPTKRFRDLVRDLRRGDRVTACGEFAADAGEAGVARANGTLKLEKFALREPVTSELVNPTCPECGRSMASAGRGQGYRCRDCGTSADRRAEVPIDRTLERGWYEVPPCARRHVAKPLVRGGFDDDAHPER